MLCRFFLSVFVALALLSGGPDSTKAQEPEKTPEVPRSEQSTMIERVIRDGVQMFALAAKAEDPLSPSRTVEVRPEPVAENQLPAYAVSIKLGPEGKSIECKVIPNETVWSASTYQEVFAQVRDAFQIQVPQPPIPVVENSLVAFTTPITTIFQFENRRVSRLLTGQPLSAEGHNQAALVSAMFGLREQAGQWWDPRLACNRTVAHLAMAQALKGDSSDSRELAELILDLLMDRKIAAAARIKKLEEDSQARPQLKPWVMAAKLRNSRDWRILKQPTDATMLEMLEFFRAKCETVNVEAAVKSMGKTDLETFADWSRIAMEFPLSVQQGHRFDLPALDGELKDQLAAFGENRIKKLEDLMQILNSQPGGAVRNVGEKSWEVQVLDDGIWGQFFQRHLFAAMAETMSFLQNRWGVPQYAVEYRQKTGERFKSLSLFPLYAAWISKDPAEVSSEEKQAIAKLMAEHPEQVREALWIRMLDFGVAHRDDYHPPALREWFAPIIPTGTAFAAVNRLNYLAGNAPDKILSYFAPYLQIAPTRLDLRMAYVKAKYGNNLSYDELKQEFGDALEFDLDLMRMAAQTLKADPVAYPAKLQEIAQFSPDRYYGLGEYYRHLNQKEKAADAYQHYFDLAEDRVGVANGMDWLVQYYEDTGKTAEAFEIADAGAKVYSFAGLETMAKLMERRGSLSTAETYYSKIAERYDDKGPLQGFYTRQLPAHPEYQKSLNDISKKLFPGGVIKVTLDDFKGEPGTGVRINETNALTQKAGIELGDLIVALDGIKVDTMEQFMTLRSSNPSPVLKLIIYQKGKYIAIESSPPDKRFGIDISTYKKP